MADERYTAPTILQYREDGDDPGAGFWGLWSTTCNDCGALIEDGKREVHDKFHDSYKPPRRASFIVENPDHSYHVQFIDGSVADLPAVEPIDEEHHLEIWATVTELLNGTNAALAPFYEGGETSAVTTSIEREVRS